MNDHLEHEDGPVAEIGMKIFYACFALFFGGIALLVAVWGIIFLIAAVGSLFS